MILFQTKDWKNNLLLSSPKNNDKSKYEERENNKDKIYTVFWIAFISNILLTSKSDFYVIYFFKLLIKW